MIRDKLMPVPGWLYGQLKLVAELQGADCAETIAEAWLRERLDAMPEIGELARLRAEHRKLADTEWREKYQPKASL